MLAGYGACKVCGEAALDEVREYRLLPRVTSDCVAFRAGGRLLVCCHCGAAQSYGDEQWLSEIGEIYSDYHAYHQSGGVEQHVVDAASGDLRRRSEVLVDRLLGLPGVPRSGKVLDVGCGTGGTLMSFAERGGWRLHGLEMDEKNLPFLATLSGFDTLHTCAPSGVPDHFDLITMVHALEHFLEPSETLQHLKGKLAPGGKLFVEVPNADANPFDLVIADHMLHFTPSSLSRLITRSGFAVDCLSTDWVTKELSLTAQAAGPESLKVRRDASPSAADHIRARVDWLWRFVDAARKAANTSAAFGLFGTSIAATWLCGVLGDAVSFFVEEDPNRAGRPYLGRDIVTPTCVKPGAIVYLALIPPIAEQVARRLQNTIADLRLPPQFAFPTA
jgi:2-polyprenyl-3-methyl-5-hydroxy-6-metoxy-1,4-benzoquinol methylase